MNMKLASTVIFLLVVDKTLATVSIQHSQEKGDENCETLSSEIHLIKGIIKIHLLHFKLQIML